MGTEIATQPGNSGESSMESVLHSSLRPSLYLLLLLMFSKENQTSICFFTLPVSYPKSDDKKYNHLMIQNLDIVEKV